MENAIVIAEEIFVERKEKLYWKGSMRMRPSVKKRNSGGET